MSKISHMAPLKRDKRINVVATEDEVAKLQELADHEGVSMSDFLRQFIRRRHAEVFDKAPPPRPRSKRRK